MAISRDIKQACTKKMFFFFLCIIAVLICVYLISPKLISREQSRVPIYTHEPFPKSSRKKTNQWIPAFTNGSNNTIGNYPLKHARGELHSYESYSYDIAIVSISPYWEASSTLPREVTCKSTNTTILIWRATGEEQNISRANMLIFSTALNVYNWTYLQRMRHSSQVWVHTTEESPFNSLRSCPPIDMNIHFNLSSTYHPKADIFVPYGEFIPYEENDSVNFASNFNEKSKLIVWVSSHCFTLMWRRSDFAYDLAKYLPLDTYGACGSLDCPKRQPKCRQVFKRYKFFLALENSCCGGYITEKFWKALTHLEAIPVVVGAPKKDYEKLAPNNSFIHADDFRSMKELADYILKVSKSKELFDSYFQWKRQGTAKMNRVRSMFAFEDEGVCRIIKYLKSPSSALLDVPSFDPYGPNWFGGCNKCGQNQWLRNFSNFNYDLRLKQIARKV